MKNIFLPYDRYAYVVIMFENIDGPKKEKLRQKEINA